MRNTKPSLGQAYGCKHKSNNESITIEFTTNFPKLSLTQCDTPVLNMLMILDKLPIHPHDLDIPYYDVPHSAEKVDIP